MGVAEQLLDEELKTIQKSGTLSESSIFQLSSILQQPSLLKNALLILDNGTVISWIGIPSENHTYQVVPNSKIPPHTLPDLCPVSLYLDSSSNSTVVLNGPLRTCTCSHFRERITQFELNINKPHGSKSQIGGEVVSDDNVATQKDMCPILICPHVLAVLLGEALNKCQRATKTDAIFAKLMKAILQ